MYDFFTGVVVETSAPAAAPPRVVLEAGGVGYALLVSAATRDALIPGARATLYVDYRVSEGRGGAEHRLYGFLTKAERALFEMFTSVNRVGPAKALSIVSAAPPEQLVDAVLAENDALIAQARGVGRQLARLIVVEVKKKMMAFAAEFEKSRRGAPPAAPGPAQAARDAIAALAALGYSTADAAALVGEAAREIGPAATTQDLMRTAFKRATR